MESKMNTHYPKTLAVAVGVTAFVAFFTMFASVARAEPTLADKGVAASQAYMVYCEDMTAPTFSPKAKSLIRAWANSRPEVAQARGALFTEMKTLVADGSAPDEKTAWALWCALIKPGAEETARRIN
jgi:hypothetical protein